MKIGYTTGTFDDVHPGHIEFLRMCKVRLGKNSIMIVGLVTDELAERQKRPTFQSYEQRRAILEAFSFVDTVVSHTGDSKKIAYEKIKFTDLFIGEEYFESHEYTHFEIEFPEVCVHYLPCSLARKYSSTNLRAERNLYMISQLKFLCTGVCGPLFVFAGWPHFVLKFVHLSDQEVRGKRGANVYKLPIPAPRNYKKLHASHDNPMLPGINSYRELDIIPLIETYTWCSIIGTQLVYDNPDAYFEKPQKDWSHIRVDKAKPARIYNVVQKLCDMTFRQWVLQSCEEEDKEFVSKVQDIIENVVSIVRGCLIPNGIVHGDLHADNIMLYKKPKRTVGEEDTYEVVLIDWGWCMHSSFAMCDEETRYYQQCLQTEWDLQHFKDSLEFVFHAEPWFKKISIK